MSTVVRAKDYMKLFRVSLRTAQRWMASDKKQVNAKRITAAHLQTLYGLDICDLAPVLMD